MTYLGSDIKDGNLRERHINLDILLEQAIIGIKI
jgi:hypothetical protein